MTLPINFQFSQGSLQDFVDCPRRFQLKYIEKLAWPALETEPALKNENYLQQGAAFHRLAQQCFLGISVEKLTAIAAQDAHLTRWWDNFLESRENLKVLKDLPAIKRYPEINLSAPNGDYRLVAKYDLLSVSDDNFTIYDWKTSRKQPKREWISASLQTRVYPLLLVKAGAQVNKGKNIPPSKIKMVYWYANFSSSPLTFFYSNSKYYEDKEYIDGLINEIKELGETKASMTENEKRCRFCIYRSLCNRGVKAGSLDELDNDEVQDGFDFKLDFEQIAEIEF